MKARRTRVCRWCLQPLPDWTDIWPHEPGAYLFFGYPLNKRINKVPSLTLVVVETYTDTFGTIYRTPRSSLKQSTGAAGFFMPLMVPSEFPALSDLEDMGNEAAEKAAKARTVRVKKALSRRRKR
jgi:hypothetical protein